MPTGTFIPGLGAKLRGSTQGASELAFDVAKKAERALQHELGDPALSYLQYDYTSGKQGLLAGEKLFFDIKRMETAFHDLNRRDPELTDTLSLLQLDPRALLQLRESGSCSFSVPEEFFEEDCPGHYFRRIKTVAISIPCVVGPNTCVNCMLTMQKSTIRTDSRLLDGYARDGNDDERFNDHYGNLDAVITSSGQNDSGMFETNLHDERYLPFEGSGAISDWRLELPADFREFDYETISDVYLHIRYTARFGGDQLRDASTKNSDRLDQQCGSLGTWCVCFLCVTSFPPNGQDFQSAPAANPSKPLAITLADNYYPYWSKGRLDTVTRIDLFAKRSNTGSTGDHYGRGRPDHAGRF